MVMQYLIQRNDEYIDKMKEFDKRLDALFNLLESVEYNVKNMQEVLHTLRTTDAEDKKLKENFNAKRQRQI